MAFVAARITLDNLGAGCSVNSFIYNSADTPATCAGSGYFDAYHDTLKLYDQILLINPAGSTVNRLFITTRSATTSQVEATAIT
jgi:hypothetical protein